jgi:hypothetical protein
MCLSTIASGLYYKTFTIVIYDRSDSTMYNQYYKTIVNYNLANTSLT